MLEWKAQILALMVSVGTFWDEIFGSYNWNW